MRLLFVHGAGGYADDLTLAGALGEALSAEVEMPRMPDEDMSVEAWSRPIRQALAGLGPEDHLVGHSFGATILLHVLAATTPAPRRATLLAMPDWGPQGWDVEDYVPPVPPATALDLHHCRDDEVVEIEHLALNTERLPGARAVVHDRGGHQFEGLAEAIAHVASSPLHPFG